MLLFFKKKLINKIFTIILFFLTISYTNFFLNIYLLINQPIETRLTNGYGYCDKQGYGFIKKYSNKYNFKNNTKIINSNENLFPNSGLFIDQFHINEHYEYIIIINSRELPPKKKILEQEFNCYILKND